jgi:hypothetical protein
MVHMRVDLEHPAGPVLDVPAQRGDQTSEALSLLAAGVPLSLILDLADLNLAKSKEIARVERADTAWVTAGAA